MKYGYLASGVMLGWEIERVCNYLKSLGYEGIELMPGWVTGEGVDEEARRRVVRAAQNEGMEITELVLQRDLVVTDEEERKAAVDYVCSSIPLAEQMGITTVNLFTGPKPWIANPVIVGRDVSQSVAWSWVFSAFDKILEVAQKHKVKIAVENVWGMLAHDFYTNMYLQNHFDSDFLGVNLDPSHDILYGNTDMKMLVEGWGKKIFHVHLKDAVGIPENGKYVFPLLGEGIVNWKEFFTALDGIGYTGFGSVEFESGGLLRNQLYGRNEESAKISMEALKAITRE